MSSTRPPHLTTEKNYRDRFFNEARAVSRLEHPNICSLFDIGETDDKQLFIAMPYYKGQTLEKMLRQNTLPVNEAINITLQIAAGLEAAHAQDIVHRDLKPANVMLDQNNIVKILDFGVAKISGVNMTSTGVSLGTVAYMSPEQLTGEPVSASTDLWALGIMLYEMLTGKRPFKGEQAATIIHSVLYADAPDLKLPDEFPAQLNTIINKALARQVSDRYQCAREMIDDLATISATGNIPGYIQNHAATSAQDKTQNAAHNQAQPVPIEQSVIDEMVTTLTQHLGPIAAVLVPKFAKTSPDVSTLCLRLHDYLPDNTARKAFRKQFQSYMTAINTVTSMPQAPVPDKPAISQAQQDCVGNVLTSFIGPIANTLVKRYARQAPDTRSLCDMLCQHIEDENDRTAFVNKSKTCFD